MDFVAMLFALLALTVSGASLVGLVRIGRGK